MIRRIVKAIIPDPIRRTLRPLYSAAERERRRERAQWDRLRQAGDLVYEKTGGVVVAGPFRGLRYVQSPAASTVGPKLLGTYEKELASIVERIIAQGYDTIVNVGAGEGYYAVGLGKRVPWARIVCFEAGDRNREPLRQLAELNGVGDRMSVQGFCTAELLSQSLPQAGKTLVVCDVEGAEVDILRPDVAAGLARADVLIEMHDILRPGVSEEIDRRFRATHQIEVVWAEDRTPADWPAGVEVEPARRLGCLDEGRGGRMSWFWMVARAGT